MKSFGSYYSRKLKAYIVYMYTLWVYGDSQVQLVLLFFLCTFMCTSFKFCSFDLVLSIYFSILNCFYVSCSASLGCLLSTWCFGTHATIYIFFMMQVQAPIRSVDLRAYCISSLEARVSRHPRITSMYQYFVGLSFCLRQDLYFCSTLGTCIFYFSGYVLVIYKFWEGYFIMYMFWFAYTSSSISIVKLLGPNNIYE